MDVEKQINMYTQTGHAANETTNMKSVYVIREKFFSVWDLQEGAKEASARGAWKKIVRKRSEWIWRRKDSVKEWRIMYIRETYFSWISGIKFFQSSPS